MKRIAVLTSGGDCSGMNAAIRAVVRAVLSNKLEVIGIQKCYQGLIDQQYERLTTKSVSSKLQLGGTFLQSARCLEMLQEPGQKLAADNLKGMSVEGLRHRRRRLPPWRSGIAKTRYQRPCHSGVYRKRHSLYRYVAWC